MKLHIKAFLFLQNKLKLMNNETIEFEYFHTERFDYLKNDLMQEF